MARPRTQLGTWGRITLTPHAWNSGTSRWDVAEPKRAGTNRHQERWRARCKVRDLDGTLRDVERWGDTRTQAEQSLQAALRDRTTPSDGSSGLTGDSRVRDASALWLQELEGRDLAHGTMTLYRYSVVNYLDKLVGDFSLREVKPPNVDKLLRTVKEQHGPGSAKTTRAVLSGVLGLAVRHGALTGNPVREAAKLSSGHGKRTGVQPRALTRDEAHTLREKLAVSERAATLDLADLVTFMLGTGCRIGEAAAVRWDRVVLTADGGTVEIDATVIRVKGVGLQIQERPKTAAGWRTLALPPHLVKVLRQRRLDVPRMNPYEVVFPSPSGKLRDPSNTASDLRKALDDAGFTWATSHTFRKSVATRLDEAGLSAREIADQLGHARPSLTQDVYMGRKVVTEEAAHLL